MNEDSWTYKQYGIHKLGTRQYIWLDEADAPTAVDVARAHCNQYGHWEPVWRNVSEAILVEH